jgi:hypothetical protein
VKVSATPLLPVLQQVTPPWRSLVLVCGKCEGARHGPGPKDVRKCLKKQLGKTDDARIIEVDCLKVCPDDAVTVCVVSGSQAASELYLVDSEEGTEVLAKQLSRR